MKINMYSLLYNRWVTVIFAITFGYLLWYEISKKYISTITVQVPICFYNTDHTIEAPEFITAHLQGTMYDLFTIKKQIAIHIDAKKLEEGEQDFQINSENLFLPHSVKLLHLIPSIITIHN